MSKSKKFKNAALLIIGNEILSGRTQDKNINYLAKQLFSHGISLEEVRIIPDVKSTIIKTVKSLKSNFNYIISTGGIGATHDDITAESISAALKKDYCLNKKALKELEKYYKNKSDLTDARKKMAYIICKKDMDLLAFGSHFRGYLRVGSPFLRSPPVDAPLPT